MKFDFLKIACAFALTASSGIFAAGEAPSEYFDCWLEKPSNIIPSERTRIGADKKDVNVCGCYRVSEKAGTPKQVTKVFSIPKPRVTDCSGESCSNEMAMKQCIDYVQSATATLRDFGMGHRMEGSIATSFDGDGWQATPFGEYYEKNAEKADDISCFFNIHERPNAPVDNRLHPENFAFSGMPKKMVPSALGRFTDYSDIRCLDNGELTGFSFNGYKENLRHVDKEGRLQGEEIGYLNDPSYPKQQDSKWGQVIWTSNHKNGMREGKSYFYKSSVQDGSDKNYYFKHLEVPYKQNFKDGMAHIIADNGFVMADVPLKRDGIHGRMTVNNPFKKKKITLTFNANQLEGFVDFGDFGGVYHNGLPNGLFTFWAIKDTCYQWMPGETVCHTERIRKTQWGSYKMGKFSGKMECWDGTKGGVDLLCPELPADSLIPASVRDSIAKLDSAATKGDSAAMAAVKEGKIKEMKEKAEQIRANAAKAREAAMKAELAAKQAEEEAAKAEAELLKEENPAEAAPATPAPARDVSAGWEDDDDDEDEAPVKAKPAKKKKDKKKSKKSKKK